MTLGFKCNVILLLTSANGFFTLPLAAMTQVPVNTKAELVFAIKMLALVGLLTVTVLLLSFSAAPTSVVAILIEYAVTSSCNVQILPVDVALDASKITFCSCL